MALHLLKFLDEPWERARNYLRDDLDHLEAAFNQQATTAAAAAAVTNVTLVTTVASADITNVSPIPSLDGEDGEMGIPGPVGPRGAIGSPGAPGMDGQDGDDFNWPTPGSNFQDVIVAGFIPYTGATTNVNLGVRTVTTTGTINSGAVTAALAGTNPLLINNSNADAGVTNACYMIFQTASATRWYVGMSAGGGTGNFDIYNNIAGNLAFTIDKTTSQVSLVGNLKAPSVRGTAVTVANLPATPVEGMLVAVTDSTTVVWGAIITGTGANHVLAYYNGTNWTVAGK